MPKLVLKHKIAKQSINDDIQLAFITSAENKEVVPKEKSKNIGITSSMFFFLTFFYIYLSATILSRKTLETRITYSSNISNGIFPTIDNFTLSEAVNLSDKIGTTIMIIITVALTSFYYKEQNLYEGGDSSSTFVLSFMFIIMSLWILLFFITTDKFKNTHRMVAFLILIFLAANSFVIYKLYTKYYIDNEDLSVLKNSAYSCVSVVIISFLCLVIAIIFDYLNFEKMGKFFKIIFSFSEILVIITYCIFLISCALLPPLPNSKNLKCVLTE